MVSQLYFWKPLMEMHKKELTLVKDYYDRTKLYFENIEGEAESYANSIYNNYTGSTDMDVVAEWASEKGLEMYQTLAIMKSNHLLMTISMLYYVWEQQLRRFIINELRHSYVFDKKRLEYSDIQEILELHGVKIGDTKSWSIIRELKFLVNTIKHGDGNSADKLRKVRPDFFKHKMIETDLLDLNDAVLLDSISLQIDENDLYNYVNATKGFWDEMPERAFESE